MVFLVGGAGNGKSRLAAEVVQSVNGRRKGPHYAFAQRNYEFELPNARYDWESMYAWLTWHLFEKGVPPSQSALIALVQDWFVQNSRTGEVPDESTIRKRLIPLWRKLRGEEPVG